MMEKPTSESLPSAICYLSPSVHRQLRIAAAECGERMRAVADKALMPGLDKLPAAQR